MKMQARTRSHAPWPFIGMLAISAMAFPAIGWQSAHAQSSMLVVHVTKGLDFGTLERRDTTTIDYRSTSAAQFVVAGEQNLSVRLSLSVVEPVRPNDALQFSVASDQCAYSLDLGLTWFTFASGGLTQDLQFPSDITTEGFSEIYVRVGGTFIASESQRRGDYAGSISLGAAYIDGDTTSGEHGVPARRMGRQMEAFPVRSGPLRAVSSVSGGSQTMPIATGRFPAVSVTAGSLPVVPVRGGVTTTATAATPANSDRSDK